jgi:LmbE family N-acetylglucosaminyl deacetylase
MLGFRKSHACWYVPDGVPIVDALGRTTHMCIAAHQDDIEIFAYHGISECYQKAEKWFTGVILTDGAGSPRKGKYSGFSDSQMKQVRVQEQNQAAELGGYSAQIQLGYSSQELKDSGEISSVEDLVAILELAQPEVLYVHNPADKHDTHVAALLRTLTAIQQLSKGKKPRRLLAGEVWRGLD